MKPADQDFAGVAMAREIKNVCYNALAIATASQNRIDDMRMVLETAEACSVGLNNIYDALSAEMKKTETDLAQLFSSEYAKLFG